MIVATVLVAVSVCGWLAGSLLLRRAQTIAPASMAPPLSDVTIIVPARNEEQNLPRLLVSLAEAGLSSENILVADDASDDGTADVALSFGATVVPCPERPVGWKGKPWACWSAAQHAKTTLLFFVDADTRFLPGGLAGIVTAYHCSDGGTVAMSVLPFHTTLQPYEQLSLFFNVLLAAGAGGFTGLDEPALFGQSLLIEREFYLSIGGHGAVREHVLENLHLARFVAGAGGTNRTALGAGTLEMRMFPGGLQSLWQSWKKGFASGAGATPPRTMLLAILWLSGAATPVVALAFGSHSTRTVAAALYVVSALQIAIISRRLGTYRVVAALLYPVPLVFYFALFGLSVLRAHTGQTVAWKGREV